MDVFVVLEVGESHFEMESGDGVKRRMSLEGITWPIQADMPVLCTKDGRVCPYPGAFFDEEDGVYKKLTFEDGRFALQERPMPLKPEEIQAFLCELVRTNDPSLKETLDMTIEDLLAEGQTELAFALMNRLEALAPSESLPKMQAKYAEERRAAQAREETGSRKVSG